MKLFWFGKRLATASQANIHDRFTIDLPNHRLQFRPGGTTLIVAFDNAARPVNETYEGRATWGEHFTCHRAMRLWASSRVRPTGIAAAI